MTNDDLLAIEARANAATPGPWEEYASMCCPDMGGVSGPKRSVCVDKVGRYGHPSAIEDAAFIAHAREDIPRLIARVRELEAQLISEMLRWKHRTTVVSMPLDDEGLVIKLDYADAALRAHAKHLELKSHGIEHDEEPCEHCHRMSPLNRDVAERLQRLENWFDRKRKK